MSKQAARFTAFAAILVALLWSFPSAAQVLKGSISGTVTDPQGNVVQGATVKITNTATGKTGSATTDSSGAFRLNLLEVGTYKVDVTQTGFKTATQSIIVNAGADSGVGVRLTVGDPGTTVEVSADAPL